MVKITKINADLPTSSQNNPSETAEIPSETGHEHSPKCELCEAARFTHWYWSDATCWVADCEVCNVPMVVWNSHGTAPAEADVTHMHTALERAANERFGSRNWVLDTDMRTIPDHFHAHARDADWFAERARRPASKYSGVGGERLTR